MQKSSSSPRLTVLVLCVLTGIVAACLLAASLQIWNHRLEVPIVFGGDTIDVCVPVKAMMEGSLSSTRLGAPGRWSVFLYPLNAHVDFALAAAIGRIFDSFGAGVNLGWIAKIFLGAALATWALHVLGIPWPVAMVSGLLYGLSPYAVQKGVWHYNLGAHLLPPVGALAILLLRNAYEEKPRSTRLLMLLWLIPLGFNDPYAAIFSLIVLGWTSLGLFLTTGWSSRTRTAVFGAGILFLCTGLNAAPGLIAAARQSDMSDALGRTPAQSIQQGLKPAQLLQPLPSPVFPGFRRAREAISQTLWGKEVGGDAWSVNLGTFAAAGFILLLLAGAAYCVQFAAKGSAAPPWLYSLGPPALLTLLLVLVCSQGGLNVFIATFLTPMVRSWERASSMVGFLAVYASACGLTALGAWLQTLPLPSLPRTLLGALLLAGIAVASVVEQTGIAYDSQRWEKSEQDFADIKSLCRIVEETTGPGACVYHLPDAYMYYSIRQNVPDASHSDIKFAQLRPYLLSKRVRWSSAMLRRTDEWDRWHKTLSAYPYAERFDLMELVGFAGVWLDRVGLPPAESKAALEALRKRDGVRLWDSPSGRYTFALFQQADGAESEV